MNKKDYEVLLNWLEEQEKIVNLKIDNVDRTKKVHTDYDMAVNEYRLIRLAKLKLAGLQEK